MKSLALIALALVSTTSFAAHAKHAATPTGQYSNPTVVVDYDAKTEKKCKELKGQWDGECYTPAENSVSVYKIAGTKNQYFVTIFVISPRLNMCDVQETFTRTGTSLNFTAEDKSTLRLTRRGNKIVVQDNGFSQSNCGHNAPVGGEYTRRGETTEVDQIDIADIKECGFKGCLN
jgi:hypothetical protein